MKMSSVTKSLSIDHLLAIFLSLIPLLQIKALALETKTSLNTINVASNETDFHALLAIKSNIFQESQQALSSWNESLHFCLWEGVECGRRHKRVTTLNLMSRGLTGTLSPYIGNLSFLQEIGLYNNTFTGEIPTELGNLFWLRVLRLSLNLFEGKFPTSLYRCSNLMVLILTGNKLVGEFPKEVSYSMPRLETLYIGDNNLTGGVPPSIGNITSLERFSATDNPLGGTIPNALGKLKNLKYFGLSAAQLSENNGQHEFVGLDLIQRIDIAIDVACALDYLHNQCGRPIIHCDLKPSNVLLDSDMVAHVGDFGLARFRAEFTTPSTSSSTAIRGTIGYAAPEYGLGSEMSTSGDVYSYGILLLEMITRKQPTDKIFEADPNLHNFVKIAFPERAMEIIDPMLLTEENHGSKMVEYLIPVLKIGLACSAESPLNRMSINSVLHKLHLVKNNILKRHG